MENMSLIHHIAYDGNIDCLKELHNLHYIKDIVNDDNNDVIIELLLCCSYDSKVCHLFIGLH